MRALSWLWRRFRPAEGRFLFLSLVVAVVGSAYGVMEARWVPGHTLFWHVALVAALLGRWLGRTRVRRGWAALLLGAGGILYTGWGVIHLTTPLWAALQAALGEDGALAGTWLEEAASRLQMLGQQIAAWVDSWGGKGPPPGSIIALLWMALILWACAAFAGWSLVRGRHPLFAFLPLASALTLSVYLAGAGRWHLLLLLACLVAAAPVSVLRRLEADWDARQVGYSEEFRFDAVAVAAASTLIFVLLAVVFPNFQVSALTQWVWRQSQDPQERVGRTLERAFPGTRPAARRGLESAGATLPRQHLLGGRPELAKRAVMRVAVDEPPPVLAGRPAQGGRPQRAHYWEGTAYSDYVGTGWQQARLESVPQGAYVPLGPAQQPGRRPLRQEFSLLVAHGTTLYAASEANSLDQAVTVKRLPEGGDLVALEGPLDHYSVLSLVPEATGEALKAAPATYPAQIAGVYLDLPEDLPQRVVELTREVTSGARTPYERAAALEAYLRSFPYDLKVAGPPEGRDVVDYYLFDLQRGYCDYAASAMVVMARAVGIPARLAVGYAMGSYDLTTGAYLVTERDAHAWPELYFPGYGWIPFEPTSGLAPLEIAGQGSGSAPGGPSSPPARSSWVRLWVEARLAWLRWRWWVLLGAAGVVVLGLGWRAWRRRPTRLDLAGRMLLRYFRLRQEARRLGVSAYRSTTAAEFAAAMEQVLGRRRPRCSWLGAAVRREAERALVGLLLLTRVYEQMSYAPAGPSAGTVRQAWHEGGLLRRRFWGLWLLTAP